MKIGITNDHRGVTSKEYLVAYLTQMGHDVVNYGTNTTDAVDFPASCRTFCCRRTIRHHCRLCQRTGTGNFRL